MQLRNVQSGVRGMVFSGDQRLGYFWWPSEYGQNITEIVSGALWKPRVRRQVGREYSLYLCFVDEDYWGIE